MRHGAITALSAATVLSPASAATAVKNVPRYVMPAAKNAQTAPQKMNFVQAAEYAKAATAMMKHGAITAITAATVLLPASAETAAITAPRYARAAAKSAQTVPLIYAKTAAPANPATTMMKHGATTATPAEIVLLPVSAEKAVINAPLSAKIAAKNAQTAPTIYVQAVQPVSTARAETFAPDAAFVVTALQVRSAPIVECAPIATIFAPHVTDAYTVPAESFARTAVSANTAAITAKAAAIAKTALISARTAKKTALNVLWYAPTADFAKTVLIHTARIAESAIPAPTECAPTADIAATARIFARTAEASATTALFAVPNAESAKTALNSATIAACALSAVRL